MATFYKIHTKTQGTIVGELNLANPNAQVVGQTDRYTIWLPSNFGDKTFSSDYTVESGDVEEYDNITVNNGTTLTINGTLQCNNVTNNGTIIVNGELIVFDGDSISNLLKYGEWANKYDTKTMIDGTLKYSDRIPDSEDLESLVVGVEPATELQNQDVEGTWGLVDSITDERDAVLNTNRITISMTNLGEFADYSDVNTVETNLKL